eukprot:CAMPEP_0185033374 /NCGR_PEP_ID=MMETSP1103-20130426/22238_1 /TAXON_ID=36769 /ORGANISM="Paraphysomonas bandaiensis, Strain Caron Lab Isolate" /LENGTH=407 /DNA_ID=CAMNT_0027569613 /DNA_START=93 /DNA_END=1316 /DNA_ORIENTATION=+
MRNFTIESTIGECSYGGVIKRATHVPSKLQFALKIINIEQCVERPSGSEVLQNEISSLKMLSHNAFLCNLLYAYHDKINCILVLDLLEGGDLRHHLNDNIEFTENDVTFIGACISSALNHIHSRRVIHRDVKPENIVLDGQGYPRLTNFSLSYNNSLNMICTESSGTTGYMAPEVLTSNHSHSIESDFWSLGVVMFELLFGARPFRKHCPKHFVSFVEDTYKDFWATDAHCVGDIGFTSTRTCTDDYSFNASMRSTADLSEDSRRSITNLHLPKAMIIKMPNISICGERVTPAVVSVIRGLMDVRVPQRLGAGSNYGALQRHPFFRVVDWHSLQDKKIVSPLHIDVNVTRHCLEQMHARKEGGNSSKIPSKFTYKIQEIVDQYYYCSSQYEALVNGPSKIMTENLSF